MLNAKCPVLNALHPGYPRRSLTPCAPGRSIPLNQKSKPVRHGKHLPQNQCQAVDWFGKWMDARTQIPSLLRNMLKIEDAADGRSPPPRTSRPSFQTGDKIRTSYFLSFPCVPSLRLSNRRWSSECQIPAARCPNTG